jgi:hypothetical protein
MTMEPLDGNAIAGLLVEVFGVEMTTAVGTCGSCGDIRQVAETVVFVGGPGAVARCRSCEAVLVVVTTIRGTACVDLQGLADIRP